MYPVKLYCTILFYEYQLQYCSLIVNCVLPFPASMSGRQERLELLDQKRPGSCKAISWAALILFPPFKFLQIHSETEQGLLNMTVDGILRVDAFAVSLL